MDPQTDRQTDRHTDGHTDGVLCLPVHKTVHRSMQEQNGRRLRLAAASEWRKGVAHSPTPLPSRSVTLRVVRYHHTTPYPPRRPAQHTMAIMAWYNTSQL
mmetsp:Transcript_27059/g.67430  ORF Transcript_27059/g.67430 Transcript_27059/m.67430 type:complete len:100 (-) Transcript_27059:1392-1691(-)